MAEAQEAYKPRDPMKNEFPRHLPYAENATDVGRYKKKATHVAVVVIRQAFFNEGRQWGYEGEEVELSEKDAQALERVGHVENVRPRPADE